MIRTLAFVYIFASLAFAQEIEVNSLLKSTSDYIPKRHNPCDVDAACTQSVLPPCPTIAQCEAALSAVMYQPWTIAAKWMEVKSQAIFDPVFQWFVVGPVATAQQFATSVGVSVEVTDASGYTVVEAKTDGTFSESAVGTPTPYYDAMRARSSNIPTYLRFDGSGQVYYTLNIWHCDGQMYTITLFAPISSLPVL